MRFGLFKTWESRFLSRCDLICLNLRNISVVEVCQRGRLPPYSSLPCTIYISPKGRAFNTIHEVKAFFKLVVKGPPCGQNDQMIVFLAAMGSPYLHLPLQNVDTKSDFWDFRPFIHWHLEERKRQKTNGWKYIKAPTPLKSECQDFKVSRNSNLDHFIFSHHIYYV